MPGARATISAVQYLPEFGRPVRIREYDRPMMSDDVETAQTVSYMDELASADSADPAVCAAVAEALDQAGIDESASDLEKAHAVYWWLKRTIEYVPTPGTSSWVDQTLITPCAVLAMPRPIGDCPQFSMLAAAMFRVLCMDSRFVTIAAEKSFPDQWSHIYNTVEVFPGQYMPFDASNGPEPGAEYAKPFKRRVWPRIVPGKCKSKEGSRDMMRSNYGRPNRMGMRNRALHGTLGDDGSTFDFGSGDDGSYDLSGAYSSTDSLSDQISSIDSLSDSVYGSSPAAGGSTGSTIINLNPGASSPTATGLLSTLINDAASVAAPIVKAATTPAPYYITNAAGQSVLYNPATGTTVGTSSLSSISPTTLLIGAGILFAVLMAGKK